MKRVIEPTAMHDPVEGFVRVVNPDQVYEDTDPLVKAFPTCFEDVGLFRTGAKATKPRRVEQATADPSDA